MYILNFEMVDFHYLFSAAKTPFLSKLFHDTLKFKYNELKNQILL